MSTVFPDRTEEYEPLLTAPLEDTSPESLDYMLHAMEHRRYSRLAPDTYATVTAGPWYRRLRILGVLISLSDSGVAVRLDEGRKLLAGSTVALDVEIPPPPFDSTGSNVTCRVKGRILWTRVDADGSQVCGIRLFRLVHEYLQMKDWQRARAILLIATVMLGSIIAVIKSYNIVWFWYDPWFQLYSVLVSVYICSRAFLAPLYRPPQDRGYMPPVSVVVAVKNEEAHIAETVRRCFQSRYPSELLEVLVVDDGSTDGTWQVLTEMRKEYPKLRIFQFPENRGKRHAMALGAQEASGEALVYIDSDSYVDPEGIYRIVQALADPQIGAVAGHVEVIVDPDNVISKMESVRYFISHRVMKAAESLFSCVTCCSGAFSAYRRSAVMEVLAPWLNQTFLGAKATFGDDRSLTNYILRTRKVVFCETARCRTYVPETWSKYFRQQLRWKKSWSRETLIASRILYRKHPLAAISYYAGVLLTFFAPLMVIRNIIVLPLFYSTSCLPYLSGLGLVYVFFCCIFLYFTRSRYWYYGLAFAGLYIGVLAWQNYYAMLTVSRTHWGTR